MLAQYDIRLTQGSQLSRVFTVRVKGTGDLWDFASRTLRMQVRIAPGQPLLLEASDTNGRLVAGTPSTQLVLVVTGADTLTLPVGHAVYDLWVDNVQLFGGMFTVDPRVTV